MRTALSKGTKRVDVCLPSPEDGNRFSFVIFIFDYNNVSGIRGSVIG
jgi:hypothetical protein